MKRRTLFGRILAIGTAPALTVKKLLLHKDEKGHLRDRHGNVHCRHGTRLEDDTTTPCCGV